MSRPAAAFAIPGDIATITGGYIYERRLLEGLRALGHPVEHLALPAGFPAQTPGQMAQSLAQMQAVAADVPLIVDGLVFGAADGLETLRAPMIAMLHHPLAHEEGLSADRRAHLFETERRNIARAAHILVPSRHTRDILVGEYAADPARITIAPPGIDRPTRPRAPTSPPLILSVGILHPRKGHEVLLRALARLTDLPWRAVIVGSAYDANHARDLEALRTELGLAYRVDLAGQVSPETLEALYAEATLFALATRYEGYGMVFAEALARGLPIVATTGGAVPQTVPPEAGLLAQVGDAAAFAEALRRLLDDGRERVRRAEASLRTGRSLPSWTETAEIASGVICRLVAPAD